MGILKRAGDLLYTFRFLTLLVTPFDKTKAFEEGIIDADGKRIKTYKKGTEAYKEYYTPFHRLVFNVKRLMSKVPGGGSRLASYAAALYLIKENYSISEKKLLKDLQEAGIDSTDLLAEENNWFVHENNDLAKGLYKLKFEKIAHPFDMPVMPGDKVRVKEDIQPCGEMFGINIYEATHVRSNTKVYVTSMELMR
tara:strand:- start:8984 stop:9568 length:585 start_codon:yes stop_codon:yes gene_type:complete